jgi:hypothetical protein
MGRSVSYLPNAKAVVYFQFDEEEHVLFDYLIEDIQEHVTGLFPNMETCDEWVGENNVILRNGVVEIAISEYCGIVSLSVRTDETDTAYLSRKEEIALDEEADTWVEKNFNKAVRPWAKMVKVGSFSNGESVYEQVLGS